LLCSCISFEKINWMRIQLPLKVDDLLNLPPLFLSSRHAMFHHILGILTTQTPGRHLEILLKQLQA
jgi:hypothetical protein